MPPRTQSRFLDNHLDSIEGFPRIQEQCCHQTETLLHLVAMLSRFEAQFSRFSEIQQIHGVNHPAALAHWLSFSESLFAKNVPTLIFPDDAAAWEFQKALKLFSPARKTLHLPSFDVSPYAGLYPNTRLVSERLRWLSHSLLEPENVILTCTPVSLRQKTLPKEVLLENLFEIGLESEIPDDFTQRLEQLGYTPSPVVEDIGTFAIRGGIIDIFSPYHERPMRMELFGDTLESLQEFNPNTQRSLQKAQTLVVAPAREILLNEEERTQVIQRFKAEAEERIQNLQETERGEAELEFSTVLHSLSPGQYFPGVEFFVSHFYDSPETPYDYLDKNSVFWSYDALEVTQQSDQFFSDLRSEYKSSGSSSMSPPIAEIFSESSFNDFFQNRKPLEISPLDLESFEETESLKKLRFRCSRLTWKKPNARNKDTLLGQRLDHVKDWQSQNSTVFIVARNDSQRQRARAFFRDQNFDLFEFRSFENIWDKADSLEPEKIYLIDGDLEDGFYSPDEGFAFIPAYSFVGIEHRKKNITDSQRALQKAQTLNFGDLKSGDLVVHVDHGIGIYDGLEMMEINGTPSEFIRLKYKDNDRLFLPIYRVGQLQKYSGPLSTRLVDKLGGQGWQKTKTKVKKHLRDIASELLKTYAERAQKKRTPYIEDDGDYVGFEEQFPYDETEDQEKAINDILGDFASDKPMDRLVCGDVGYGKTEVAMRAAFRAVQNRAQVAVLAPTTVLTFQHYESFKKRFKEWPVRIALLNRFVSKAEIKKNIQDINNGEVDIVIGTHRLLSKDVSFKNLSLLIVDEEQRFGVTHKEKIKKLKSSTDVLTLSATPIPRTLNMSLVGIRDLSLIATAPVDRLPTRTFVCKPHRDVIRKAIMSEIKRGGQIYYIHNRVQSIYGLADELREICPEARMAVAHGQMEEGELEKIMVSFFNHSIDVLICTTIVESGMDVSRANTMFIDKAHTFGLSQLYQLRGRVGRSRERAYCYLLLPRTGQLDKDAQERLRIIQENTALGSGIKIAQYDLELRGSGDILGENQSGHLNAVGYELYLELLEDTIKDLQGQPVQQKLDPEINVRVPAFIPDNYISDIRIRLSYYKALSEIESPDDLDRIEDELRDQFGKLPDPVLNLMGLMLIRALCKELQIRDLSSGLNSVSLSFTDHTPLPVEEVIRLTAQENKKYSLTPDNRLRIRIREIQWPQIYEELGYLKKLCP